MPAASDFMASTLLRGGAMQIRSLARPHFRVSQLYAVLVLVFVLAVGANALMARLLPRR
jgi:hypothetical protein